MRPKVFRLPRPLPVTLEVQTATLGLAKRLDISKELIRECVTVLGCCCMPLLYYHLMDSCSYVCKNTLLAAKGGCIIPPKSATGECLDVRVYGCETKVVRVRLVCAAKYLTCGFLPLEWINEPPSCIVLCREKANAKN